MNAPSDTTLVERTEWLLGLGAPQLGSRFWIVYSASLVALSLGWIIWPVLSGGGVPQDAVFLCWGALFLGLWVLADAGGSLLYIRYGAASGRALRIMGHAVFFPVALCFYLAQFWSLSTWWFVVEALVVGGYFAAVAIRVAKRVKSSR